MGRAVTAPNDCFRADAGAIALRLAKVQKAMERRPDWMADDGDSESEEDEDEEDE